MKSFVRIYVLFILFYTFNSDELEDEEDIDLPVVKGDKGVITTSIDHDILILTQENFDLEVPDRDIILVQFFAPWCGHCKTLAPQYAIAAKMLKEKEPPIPLAKIDATVENDLVSRFQVSGFPTLFIFRKGVKYEYNGPMEAMGIVEYMEKQADPNWKPPPEVVIALTKDNFTSTITNAELILVEFYAPWCGHCKQLAPEYEKAAKILKTLPTPIPLAKVDGIAEKELADKYEAKAWPTLMIFRNGKKFPYNGPRQEAGIVNYMKEQAVPASKESTSDKSLKLAMNKIDVTIIGFFKSKDEPLYSEFLDSANNLREKFKFHHTFDSKAAEYFNVKPNSIVLFHPEIYATEYEKSQYKLSKDDSSSEDITRFIKKNVIPLVGERSLASRWKYQDTYPLVVVYYDVDFSFEHRVQTQLIRKEVAKVANKYKGKITFAVSNEEQFQQELVSLGLDDSGEDVNVGYFESDKNRYRMEPTDDFSVDELQSFVENVLAGKVPRQIKSQPVPKVNKGPVITVVGTTFEKLVTKSKKNVLLEFYAPWCGHCKNLEPIYKKVGKSFENNDKVLIAKIDAIANDFPSEFEVKGFPTIYYIPANDKNKPIAYEGDRKFENLTEFINNQLKKEVKDEL